MVPCAWCLSINVPMLKANLSEVAIFKNLTHFPSSCQPWFYLVNILSNVIEHAICATDLDAVGDNSKC